MIKLEKNILKFAGGIIVIFVFCLITHFLPAKYEGPHNCRFWGIIFSGSQSFLDTIMRTHLDSLRFLGHNNPDGWGIGYYLSPDSQVLLPIISKGEPKALLDPRYDKAVDNMVKYMEKSGIAHIRSGTSGPISGIPNPHPFHRTSIRRDFQMLFAHNGSIPVDVLLSLIESINPGYLGLNPPDYEPDYLDSDLFAIFIMEIIDTFNSKAIEECIKIAITKLDSALNVQSAECNFVMSDGSTLWALRFSKSSERGLSLYYYPLEIKFSSFWIAASAPLDKDMHLWAAVPGSTLVVLKPGENPQLIDILEVRDTSCIYEGLNFIYPNPFRGMIDIKFNINSGGFSLKIHDICGRVVKEFNNITHSQSQFNQLSWDGKDNLGNNLPHGIYFCNLTTNDTTYTRKMVLLK